MGSAFPDFIQSLGEAGVDDAALGRGDFFVSQTVHLTLFILETPKAFANEPTQTAVGLFGQPFGLFELSRRQ
ncbi:MAG: hypothetical protein HY650_12390 [Acidobacteria bacterium]|nr:hypothetical protein [Acidobacteriota bacterium]